MAVVTARRIDGGDLRTVIMAQLPRDLQGKLSLTLHTDAYRLAGIVEFTDKRGGSWKTTLETTEIEGIPVACQLPAWFIDHLCLAAA